MGGRPREALSWAEKGIALADELGVENVVRHLQFRGLARLELGDAAGLSDMREALDLSLRLGLGIETATSYNNLAEMLVAFEGVAAGLELNETSLDFARRRGQMYHEMWIRAARLWYLYELGEWDELLRERNELVRWDRDQGGGTQIEVIALIVSAPVCAHRGRMDEAARHAAVFIPRAREIADPQTLAPALAAAAVVSAMGGDLAEALALVEELQRTTRGLPRWRIASLPTVLRVCVAARKLDLAEKLLDESSGEATSPASRHSITSGRAILAEAHGDSEEAATLYREAAAGWRDWGSVPERAYCLLGLGRCGDEDARREAEAIFGRLRAIPFAALAA